MLSLERLEHLCGRRLQRIGLSATQRPLEEVARFLGGAQPEPPPGRKARRDKKRRKAAPAEPEVEEVTVPPPTAL